MTRDACAFRWLAVGVFLVAVVLLGPPARGQQDEASRSKVIPSAKNDTSPALRQMEPKVSLSAGPQKKPYRPNPHAKGSLAPPKRDPALQEAPAPEKKVQKKAGKTAPKNLKISLIKSFEGIGQGFKGPSGTFRVTNAPPDTNGAVGESQFVQWVNTDLAVFDKKTGAVQLGPVPGNTLWQGFGGNCERNNDGDPIVQYDRMAKRWILAQFSVNNGFSQCVAVSAGPDATGPYHRYEFQYDDFDDYPKMGVWPNGYFISFNMFQQDNFIGSKVCAYERAAMLSGSPARQQCFQLADSFFGLLPSDLDGAAAALGTDVAPGSAAPPLNAPNVFLALDAEGGKLDLWQFHADWTDTSKTTFGAGPAHAPDKIVAVPAYAFACNGTGGSCIPQPGKPRPEQLDTLGERLMYRLAYRRFPDREVLLATHSVDTGLAGSRTGVRWYELRRSGGGGYEVFQSGTYAPDENHRWMGSIAMDKEGNVALGFNASGKVFPGLRAAFRSPGDPPGSLSAETVLMKGTGAQHCVKAADGTCPPGCPEPDGSCALTRWGDYSSMLPDPVDDCTMWFTGEYAKTTGAYNWRTRILSVRASSCALPP